MNFQICNVRTIPTHQCVLCIRGSGQPCKLECSSETADQRVETKNVEVKCTFEFHYHLVFSIGVRQSECFSVAITSSCATCMAYQELQVNTSTLSQNNTEYLQ